MYIKIKNKKKNPHLEFSVPLLPILTNEAKEMERGHSHEVLICV